MSGPPEEFHFLVEDAVARRWDPLEALGGSWDIEHTHEWGVATTEWGGTKTECMAECPLKSGTHVRRHRWRSDPI